MDLSSISSASIGMHLAQVQNSVDISVTKKAMDFQSSQAAALIEDLARAVPASFGHRLDIMA